MQYSTNKLRGFNFNLANRGMKILLFLGCKILFIPISFFWLCFTLVVSPIYKPIRIYVSSCQLSQVKRKIESIIKSPASTNME